VNGPSDQQLLARYARHRDEGAFAELVRRQVDLVYSAARRLVVDPHLAEDVTQAVFTALARQASEVARRLEGGAPLSGWLHVTTRNHAAATVRTEERRRAREQEAVAMQEPSVPESTVNWEQIAPQLDHALAELSDVDRDALLLRFFERRTAKEIGDRLGVGEEAAQKRVTRALERLRGVFVARGLAVPSATLAGALTVNAVQTAPVALAGTVTAGVATAAGGAISTLGILQLMASAKLKLSMAALVAAGMATTVILQQRESQRLRTELATAQATQVAPLEPAATNAAPADSRQLEELLRLRGEVAQLRRLPPDLERLRAENERLRAKATGQVEATPVADSQYDAFTQQGLAKMNYARSWGLAFMLFAEANGGALPKRFEDATAFFGNEDNPGTLNAAQFEITYQGSLKDIAEPARTIILRERESVPNPKRPGLARTYLFADGHTEIHHSADGNFEPWERERMIPPPETPR
jgi:RNA polymerase sigma factor (sigma-70 family)